MRLAELAMAMAMALLSIYLMWKSAELPIGWIPGLGPGGGAFPFLLAAGTLLCSVTIIVRWIFRISPLSKSTEVFLTPEALKMFLIGVGALTVTIALFHVVGVYVALPLFLIFSLRYLGNHSWRLTSTMAAATVLICFFFFEIILHITLPKGVTEPLFLPLYAIIY